jgi:hypothetical protein
LEFFAFWDWHDNIAPLIKKYGIHPQFWLMMPETSAQTQEEKIELTARALLPRVERARDLGCKVGLYNHGGWAGEPENLVAVCQWLRANANADHVGIVYNFHHAHDHIDDFPEVLALIKPYLLCLNLNGMSKDAGSKILPIGQGEHEQRMMKAVLDSGYDGPIGIIHHRENVDAKVGLQQNLDGLNRVRKALR